MKTPSMISARGFLAGIVVFWGWFAWACAGEWSPDSEYSYGWIVLPLAIYFFWSRLASVDREGVSDRQAAVAWIVLFVCAAAVLPIELAREAPLYWRVFTWAAYATTAAVTLMFALLRGGRSYFVAALFPVIFLGTAVPWPTLIEQPLTLGLAHAVAVIVRELLPILGIPAHVEGNVIALPACKVGIEEACSGVRSLQTALMVALAVGELMGLPIWRRVLLIPIGFVLAMLANLGRTLALSLAGARSGEEGLHAIHDTAGLVALLVLVGCLFAAGRLLRTPAPVRIEGGVAAGEDSNFTARWTGVVSLAVLGIAVSQAWYFSHELGRVANRAPYLVPRESADVTSADLPGYVQKVTRPTVGTSLSLRRTDRLPAAGYHLYWDATRNNSEALYHRPDVCMPGVGWKVAGKPGTVEGFVGGRPVNWAVLPYEKNSIHALMLWAAWLDGEPLQFSLHTGSSVQQNALVRLIANGRRKFTYEVAAVMIPYYGEVPPVQEAVDAAAGMFGAGGKP